MATKKKADPRPPEKVVLYEKLIALFPTVELKGANMLYTSLNGNMYSWMNEEGVLALRMSKVDREAFIEKYDTELHKAYGLVQREYVSVPDALLRRTSAMKVHFAASLACAESLKPKATTRKAVKKKS